MTVETNDFIVTNPQHRLGRADPTLTSHRGVSRPDNDVLVSFDATCKSCGHSWHATRGEGKGKFRSGVGVASLECQRCPTSGHIPIGKL